MWQNPYVHLEDMDHHKELCRRLHGFITTWEELPHLLVYGPPGTGKKHIVKALLLDKFGKSVLDATTDTTRPYCITIRSPYHMEYFLTEKTGTEFTEELIQNVQFLNVATTSFHVVILHGLHTVSRMIQSTIRQIMDQQFRTVRFIIITRTLTRIRLIKDRCLLIRVPVISKEECASICFKRSSELCDGKEFFEKCNGNLLDIFIHMEFHLQQQKTKEASSKTRRNVKKQEYIDIEDILQNLFISISQKNHKNIQQRMFQLYVIPLNAHDIVRLVTMYCVSKCKSDSSKTQVVQIGAKYDSTLESVSNVMYPLIVFCYELATLLSNEDSKSLNKDIPKLTKQ